MGKNVEKGDAEIHQKNQEYGLSRKPGEERIPKRERGGGFFHARYIPELI